jgi:hypothetical protein
MNADNSGGLLINLRYANNAVPVGNANVVLRDGSGNIIGEYVTGEDGKTEAIYLPIGEYTVSVFADGFIDMTVTNIPVSEFIMTIQTIQLFPIYNYSAEVIE